MRKLVTTVATAVTLGVMGLAGPASADQASTQAGYNQPYKGPSNLYAGGKFDDRPFDDGSFEDQGFDDRGYRGHGYDDRRFNRNGNFSITFDFGRYDRGFDRWERGWGHDGYQNQYRFHQPLNAWRLVRRLEAQGYYGVRGLRPARWGFGYRAFAVNHRGMPVMLRIDPYTGRVLNVRYI